MSKIVPMTLFNIPGFLITTPDGKKGVFGYKDEGERIRKKKTRGHADVLEKWKKIWLVSVYHSERLLNGTPWRYCYAGGKYAFSRCHFDPDMYVLLFDLLPFLYKEYFGAVCPWNSTPVDIKKEFKPKDEDDEVSRLLKEMAGLRA